MKNSVLISLVILLSAAILFSCSKPIQKKLAGKWKVEDVKFERGGPLDPAETESSIESQKSISYELLEDFTAKVHAGFSVLEGNWIYKEAETSVYMVFSGTSDTILLGRYEDGKLINEETKPDIKITTIFIKEDK
jgi:hypothetical protein